VAAAPTKRTAKVVQELESDTDFAESEYESEGDEGDDRSVRRVTSYLDALQLAGADQRCVRMVRSTRRHNAIRITAVDGHRIEGSWLQLRLRVLRSTGPCVWVNAADVVGIPLADAYVATTRPLDCAPLSVDAQVARAAAWCDLHITTSQAVDDTEDDVPSMMSGSDTEGESDDEDAGSPSSAAPGPTVPPTGAGPSFSRY